MKTKSILTLLVASAIHANAALWLSEPNIAIPDANYSGVASSLYVNGEGSTISDVSVSLNVSGGWNGDLYAYLVAPDGTLAVLLNRVGRDTSNTVGYGNAGFNLTLSAAGNDIHNYQAFSPVYSGGMLTGSWAADGRSADPASVTFGSPRDAGLGGVLGSDPNGQWHLFISDVSAGDQSTLNSWSLNISTVPEPTTSALVAFGLVFVGVGAFRHHKGRAV